MIRALSSEPLNDRWVITGLVGRGSSGTVYRGFDLVRERLVAIKTVGPRAPGARAAQRARREFLDMAAIRHPNLVETFDMGTAASGPLRPGAPFFTMELLEPPPPAMWSGDLGPVPLARLALDLLAALACVHGHGLVHNDVKPANVLLERKPGGEPRVKLSDLGLASRAGRAIRGDAWRGTVQYASPETLAGGPREARSDLYSLGVLLYEAATGSLPFQESEPAAAVEWHFRGARDEAPGKLPPVLSRAIGRLLAVQPQARFANAREAWEEIAHALPDAPPSCPPGDRTCAGPLGARRRERKHLSSWLTAASDRGGALTIAGREGSGLSRFAREVEVVGRARGLVVHAWRCALADRPFAAFSGPLREMILRAFKSPGKTRSEPGTSELLALLGGPALWSAPRPIMDEASEMLAVSVARFLLAHTPERPLLVILDDYDRADRGTRRVVNALSRALLRHGGRILIVMTVHEQEARTTPRVSDTMGDAGPGRTLGVSGDERLARQAEVVSARKAARRKGSGGGAAGTRVRREPSGGSAAPSRSCMTAWSRAHRHVGNRSGKDDRAPRFACIGLGPVSLTDAHALIDTLTCIGRMHPEDRTLVYQHAEGLPGRLVRLAHAMAGRQRPLFPPLCEPCVHQGTEDSTAARSSHGPLQEKPLGGPSSPPRSP